MKTLGAGIVGYGKVAANTHRKWLTELDGVELRVVCDTTAVRREAAQADCPGAAVVDDYAALLADESVDLVIVTTPPTSHAKLAIQAAEAGKHVFVDKPFAATGEEAARMLDAAAVHQVVMHCHQNRRHDGEYRPIEEAVRAGRIGDILHIRRVWTQYGEGWATWGIEGFNPRWRVQRAYGGGMVYDYASHLGDQILHLVGQLLVSVFADARGLKFSDEVDDHFSCLLRFANGTTAYLESSNLARLPAPHWYVIGSEGCLTAEKCNGPVTLLAEGMSEPEILPAQNDRQRLYENLLAACRGEAEPSVSPADLRATMSLIDAIFESARTGRMVELA